MRKKLLENKNIIYWLIINVFIIVMVFVFTKSFILIPIIILVMFISFIFILINRRETEKELEILSDLIRTKIDSKNNKLLAENKESLPSKIQFQLESLYSQIESYNKKTLQDKNNLQKLITEISHQLRMPLTNIKTYTNLLKESKEMNAETNRYINAINLSEEKLSFLIESFIKMSRFENSLIQINSSSRDLKSTILKAIFQLHKKIESKNIEIFFNMEEKLEIFHDENWLGEAIYNILDNSVKYSPENSKIEITISKNEMFNKIEIRDYGIGIKEERKAKSLKGFTGENISNEEGFGIGLYLSREIILKHGGFIKVKRRNPGLTIDIYI